MTEIYAIVEGSTELRFVQSILAGHLKQTAGIDLKAQQVFGNVKYCRVRPEILKRLQSKPGAFVTTMFDYYGLGSDFPSRIPAPIGTPSEMARKIEQAMIHDIAADFDNPSARSRFVPYIQMHEFEALLFTAPPELASVCRTPNLSVRFQQIADKHETPEHIDDSPQTAPSKQILQQFPRYRKVVNGALAADRIGIDRMRRACPHFDEWLRTLESLGKK